MSFTEVMVYGVIAFSIGIVIQEIANDVPAKNKIVVRGIGGIISLIGVIIIISCSIAMRG